MKDSAGQLTVVSNRLPVVMDRTDGGWNIERGSGGLVQAMTPILGADGGCWVGWPGVTTEDGGGWREGLQEVESGCDYALEPVVLSREEYRGYYRGFANSVIWPLFHGFPDRCDFDPDFWETYGEVNEKFARAVEQCHDEGMLWAHDYHLLQLARRLRRRGNEDRIGFFLHIPFPSIENFEKLPWRDELTADLLHYDVIGFQTARDLRNFEECVGEIGEAAVGDGSERRRRFDVGGRVVEAGVFPIGIDNEAFVRRASSDEAADRIETLQNDIGPYQMALGVDRLDYSKGLLRRLRAWERLLERYPELCEEVVLFQLVVPSRESVPAYQKLKREFDRVVGRINGRFATAAWQPVHHLYNSVDPGELAALYRLASVGLVTPIRDGMNLVSKEYCACQIDENGVLVLSEFAGSREQLGEGALLVNPYDLDETAEAIYRAVTMELPERRRRMQTMRRLVAETDVFWWAEEFMQRVPSQHETVRQVVESRSAMAGESADRARS